METVNRFKNSKAVKALERLAREESLHQPTGYPVAKAMADLLKRQMSKSTQAPTT